jgi:uncharacterized protein (TIGR04255 family)
LDERLMTWKPIHEAHAIDRVRILLQFTSPLTDKLLARATDSVISGFQQLGFEQVLRAESTIQSLVISVQPGQVVPEVSQNGWLLRRSTSGTLVEEAGFRDGVFGYFSTEYGRWENLEKRFHDVFGAPLKVALDSVDVTSIKLEYWDRFAFEGVPDQADIRDLLVSVDPSIPVASASGSTLWHSHSGWFEDFDGDKVLINRNIDLVDEPPPAESRRLCNIYTLTEFRGTTPVDNLPKVTKVLEHLHRRSLALFGASLTDTQRKNIGLNLSDYEQ